MTTNGPVPATDMRVPLQTGWQGGPAAIELEVDELTLDGDVVGPGVILKIETPTDPSGGMELEIGTGKVSFPSGPGRLEFWLAASMDQAEKLRDALTEILATKWTVG